MNPSQTFTIPEGVDPDTFWNAVREAMRLVQQHDDQTDVVLDTSKPASEALTTEAATPSVAVEGVINHASFEIDSNEGGRYGEVRSETFGASSSDSAHESDDDTGDGTQSVRVRARRTDPSIVSWHVLETMRSCVEHENKPERANDTTLAEKYIGWVIASPMREAVNPHNGKAHYRAYNGRDLTEDVKAHVGTEYTKAQLRTALASLVAAGSVVESGKVSKAKRYALSETLNQRAVAFGKGE
jgi:hypothetical protein